MKEFNPEQQQIQRASSLAVVRNAGGAERHAAKPIGVYARKYADRDRAIAAAYASGGHTTEEIGDFFGLHYSRVSKIVRNTHQAKVKT